jgi:hypothetical protein
LKKWTVVISVAALVFATGCTKPELQDRSSGAGRSADGVKDAYEVEVWRNVNNYPNVAIFCADGLAFFAASTDQHSGSRGTLGRLPERDELCAR